MLFTSAENLKMFVQPGFELFEQQHRNQDYYSCDSEVEYMTWLSKNNKMQS